tara:strand:+ start:1 stop:1956 length:1956 start_codon:yes stop_codon:yes gene_type:complete
MHIVELRDSMEELNIPNDIIYRVIENIINEEQIFYARSKESGRIVQYKNKDNYEKGIKDGSHEKVDQDDASKEFEKQSGEEKPKTEPKKSEEPPSKPKIVDIPKNQFDKGDDEEKDTKDKQSINTKTDTDKARAKIGNTYVETLKTSRDDFNKKNEDNQTKNVYTLPDGIKNNPKIPKKYTQLLERVLNTNRNADDNTDKADYYGLEGVGMGQLESNIGELMTMMTTTLRRKDRQEFFSGIEDHLAKTKYEKQTTHVSDKWVKAAKENSSAILRLFYDRYNQDYEIEAGAWDIEEEVREMGYDYGEKGFSTDIFFKLKTKTGDVFPEISLKQGLQANLLNTTVGSVFKELELPIHLKQSTFSDNEVANNDYYYQTNQTNVREFINNIDVTDKEFLKLAKEVGMIMSNNQPVGADRIVSQLKEMVTNVQEDLLSDDGLVIDRNYVGSIRQAGEKTKGGFTAGKKETLKPLFMLARIMDRQGDDTASEFVKSQDKLGKDYAKNILKEVNKNEEVKAAVLTSVQKKLPLKSVANGEEDIVLGQYNLTKKTLKGIFGTDDWNEIKENLEVDAESIPPVIQYSGIVRNTETKIPISTIKVREDGIGYKGAHKFDMLLDTSFAKRVKSTSDSLYGDQEELPYPIGITEPGTREPVGN